MGGLPTGAVGYLDHVSIIDRGLAGPAHLDPEPVVGVPRVVGHPISRVVVVVPARDERELIGACLDALARARAHLTHSHPHVTVDVLVVLDSCTDGTAEVVARHPVRMVTTALGVVGAVRAAGVDAALAGVADDLSRTWIACTDADSTVPQQWLTTHIRYADSDLDLVLGTVRPVGLAPELAALWRRHHHLHDGHPHIHGANLGVRASWYRAVGGFAAVSDGEDVQLSAQVRALGGRVGSIGAHPVSTSGRTVNRAAKGFAGYLVDLAQSIE